jgi:hypothetical protein
VGTNPAQGMDVCPRLSVLCDNVEEEALRLADPPFKEYCQMSNWFVISEVILTWKSSQGQMRKDDNDYDNDYYLTSNNAWQNSFNL